MGVLKEVVCDSIWHFAHRLIEDGMRTLCHTPWLFLISAIVFSLAAFNLVYPRLLLRWVIAMHGSSLCSLQRLVVPAILLLGLWVPLNFYLEDMMQRAHPDCQDLQSCLQILLSMFSFVVSVLLQDTTAGFSSRRGFPQRPSSGGDYIDAELLRVDPFKRTRSGTVYGERYDYT